MEEIDQPAIDKQEKTYKLIASLSILLGIMSLCAAIIPAFGGALSIMGISLGLIGLRREIQKWAVVGISVSAIGLAISIFYYFL